MHSGPVTGFNWIKQEPHELQHSAARQSSLLSGAQRSPHALQRPQVLHPDCSLHWASVIDPGGGLWPGASTQAALAAAAATPLARE